MAHKMGGGKTPGGKAYDAEFSAFQQKGLISPIYKKPPEPGDVDFEALQGGNISTFTTDKGQLKKYVTKGGSTSYSLTKDEGTTTLSEKVAEDLISQSQKKKKMKTEAQRIAAAEEAKGSA